MLIVNTSNDKYNSEVRKLGINVNYYNQLYQIKSVFQNSLFFLKNKLELQIMHKLGVSSYNRINIAYTFIWPVIYDAFFVLTIPLKIALNIEIFSS